MEEEQPGSDRCSGVPIRRQESTRDWIKLLPPIRCTLSWREDLGYAISMNAWDDMMWVIFGRGRLTCGVLAQDRIAGSKRKAVHLATETNEELQEKVPEEQEKSGHEGALIASPESLCLSSGEPFFKRPISPTAHRKPAKAIQQPISGMRKLMAYKRLKRVALPPSPPPKTEGERKVAYVYSPEATAAADLLPVNKGKTERTHALAAAYGLLQPDLVRLLAPQAATRQQLTEFHDEAYLERLADSKPQPKQRPEKRNLFGMPMGPSGAKKKFASNKKKEEEESSSSDDDDSETSSDSDSEDSTSEEIREEDEEYGLQHDCSLFPGVFQHAAMVAGACEDLKSGQSSVAINWMGGRHHAKKDEAAGFCYCNDIVLGILSLMSKFPRVLYIDIDIHHGDGVEEAFYYTDKVFCVSFHHRAPGFYPGSGRLEQTGAGKGKYYTINVPLKAGIGDTVYVDLFKQIIPNVAQRFRPNAVVLQSGADGLVGDPLGGFNLTLRGLGECVRIVRDLCQNSQVPLLVLGGGGYNPANSARAQTYFTSILLYKELEFDIPEHRYFEDYKDNGFQLHLSAGKELDNNDEAYLDKVRNIVMNNLSNLPQLGPA